MDLFAHAKREQIEREAPLAARMRPRTLDEFVGQSHILGPGRLLRRAIQVDQLSSLIFCGPPGTGKTTLAMVIANTTRSRFITINAVLAGVKEIRTVTEEAQDQRHLHGQRTILFVDEVHRWNKAQQDALLPWVENGTIIMIGATTENPWFSMNRALLSRSRVFQLVGLSDDELREVAARALDDPERGYGNLTVNIHPQALDHLINVSNGDARSLLNALELAVETTPPNENGEIEVGMGVAEDSIQQRAVLYDPEGDYHFDTISAFIKSVRGSDPDATLYWLARMVYAGEDPRFIFRRMLILASEDIGLADPQALGVVEAAAAAFDRVGLPEGRYHLAQAALYLATTSKSNSAMGFFDALSAVESEREEEVPAHLKDANRDKEGLGHGEGYLYPHAYRDHWVAQQYLPPGLQGQVFYQPGDQGYEAHIRERVQRRREEQLAAVVEKPSDVQVLTFTPPNKARDRWLQRSISDAGRHLGRVRNRIYAGVSIQRHDLVLDLHVGAGLLTWEALRRTPEGGVWCLARDPATATAIRQQVARLPEVERPVVLEGGLHELPVLLAREAPDVYFDLVLGRNSLTQCQDKTEALRAIAGLMRPGAQLSLAEVLPREAQRLYALLDPTRLEPESVAAWREAEEAIYNVPADPMTNWDADTLSEALVQAGFAHVSVDVVRSTRDQLITSELVAGWFERGAEARPSYGDHLRRKLLDDDVRTIRDLFSRHLEGEQVAWRQVIAYVVAAKP